MQIKGSEVTPLNQGKRGTTESIEAVQDDWLKSSTAELRDN